MCLLTSLQVWSRHAHATASIFETLKRNRKQPDIEHAATVGTSLDSESDDFTAQVRNILVSRV